MVLAEPSIPSEPSECPFDDPTPPDKAKALGHWRFLALSDPDFPGCIFAPTDDFEFAACRLLDHGLASPGVATVRPKFLEGLVLRSGQEDRLQGSVTILGVCGLDADGHGQARHVGDHVPLAALDLLARIVSAEPPFSVVLTV